MPFVNAGISRLLKSNASPLTKLTSTVPQHHSSTSTVAPLESVIRQLNNMSLSKADGVSRLSQSNASPSIDYVPIVPQHHSSTSTVMSLESVTRQLNDMSLSESYHAENNKHRNHATIKAQNILDSFGTEIDGIAEALADPYTATMSIQIKERITILRRRVDKVTHPQVHEEKASLLSQLDALDTRLVELDTLLPDMGPILYDTSKFSAYEFA